MKRNIHKETSGNSIFSLAVTRWPLAIYRVALKFFLPCVWFVVLVLISPSPSLAENSLKVALHYSVKKAPYRNPSREAYDLKIIHPYSFDLETIQKCMRVLFYQDRGISWSKRKRVFTTDAIKRLGPLIVEQFTLADKNHRVIFKISKGSGKTILRGDTFLTSEGMHWRFTVMNYSKRGVEDFSVMGDSWRLVPLKGQTYKTKETHKNLVQNITNWMVFKKFRPLPSRILKSPLHRESKGDKKSPSIESSSIKKRLQVLEELKRGGLISREEYKAKRREILKSF